MAAGPTLEPTVTEQSVRQVRLQQTVATYEPIPFNAAAARSFGQIVAAVASTGRTHRSRTADLLIAAIARANGLELYTSNSDDFFGLEELIHVISL